MVSKILHSELVATRILLTREQTELVAHVGEEFACRETAIALLERSGFTKGEGPYWKQRTDDAGLARLNQRLIRQFGGMIVWDLGGVFPATPTTPPVTEDDLPALWGGCFVVRVRVTEHCLLFSRNDSMREIALGYHDEYRHYLNHEFHPGE